MGSIIFKEDAYEFRVQTVVLTKPKCNTMVWGFLLFANPNQTHVTNGYKIVRI